MNSYRAFLPVLLLLTYSANSQEFWMPTGGPEAATVTALLADHDGSIYAGTRWAGLFRSDDNGHTWRSVRTFPRSSTIKKIHITNEGILLVVTEDGALRSDDHGQSWQRFGIGDLNIDVLAVDHDSGLYAITETSVDPCCTGQVWFSADNGSSWRMILETPLNTVLVDAAIEISSCDHNFIRIVAQDGQSCEYGFGSLQFYQSTDNGATWTQHTIQDDFPGDGTKRCLSRNGTILVANSLIFRSVDNGKTWQDQYFDTDEYYQRIVNLWTGASGTLLIGFDSGRIFQSTDDGRSWIMIHDTEFPTFHSWTVNSISAYLPLGNEEILIGSVMNGVYRSTVQGEEWTLSGTGMAGCKIQSLAVGDRGEIYAGNRSEAGTAQIFCSRDRGRSWSALATIPFSESSILQILVDRQGDLYALTWYNRNLFRLSDQRESLICLRRKVKGRLGTNVDGEVIAMGEEGFRTYGCCNETFHDVDLSDVQPTHVLQTLAGDYLIGTSDCGMLRIRNIANEWQRIDTNLADKKILRLAMNSKGWIFAGTARRSTDDVDVQTGLFRSRDYGFTWEHIGFAESPVFEVVISGNDHVYCIDSTQSVYVSSNDGRNWHALQSGLDGLPVAALAVDSTGFVFAGTVGNSVYRSRESELHSIYANTDIEPSIDVFPNPSDTRTVIRLNVPGTGAARLRVLDVLGNPVATLFEQYAVGGRQEFPFNTAALAPGLYYCHFEFEKDLTVKKLMVVH